MSRRGLSYLWHRSAALVASDKLVVRELAALRVFSSFHKDDLHSSVILAAMLARWRLLMS